jgi:alpha-L-glutamate ligase-like protein
MVKQKDILGINSRSSEYLRLNKKRARLRADDKLLAKKILRKVKIPHPKLLGKLKNQMEVEKFDWLKLDGGFVIKPVQGLEGGGILLVKRPAKLAGEWILIGGKKVNTEDLKLHAMDIIEGRFSRNNIPDTVMIEERVEIHRKFKKISSGGAPDVRVIVYNKVPIMAMLRLPTKQSAGKANLHQGAVGLGIDIATGITTYGVHKGKELKLLPGTQKKVNGITVPEWNKILRMAVETQIASELGYLAVDMLVDPERGPLVLELNDQPGLSIQIANRSGLKRRLNRVEGLSVEDAKKGVRVAKALFASAFARRVGKLPGDKTRVGIFEMAEVKVGKRKKFLMEAKIDTGAYGSSIDRSLAKELGLLVKENVLWEKRYRSSLGSQKRMVIRLIFWLKGTKVVTRASVTNRKDMRKKLLIGRRDLRDFVVVPGRFKDSKIRAEK